MFHSDKSLLDQHGFTLVELLVVMVLVALISSLVFLSVASGLFKNEQRRFAEDFSADMKRCRNRAIGKGRAVEFLIDGSKRRFGIKGKKMKEIPSSVEVRGEGLLEIEPGLHGLVFYPDASSSGGEIELRWEGGRVDIFKVGVVFARIDHEVKGTE